jgi:hypothetical protein
MCLLRPMAFSLSAALVSLLRSVTHWLLVTVLVIAPLTLGLRVLFSRLHRRTTQHGSRQGDEP